MRKRISVLAAPLACTLFLCALTGCGAHQASAVDTAYSPLPAAVVTDGRAQLSRTAFAASEEERAALAGMTCRLENDDAALYIGEYADIAVLDKQTGAVFFSNRLLHTGTPDELTQEQKKESFSQVTVQYFRDNGQSGTATSFPECWDGKEKQQITVAADGDELAVTYAFGTLLESKLMCSLLTRATYDRLAEKAEQLLAAGELKRSDWGRFTSVYNHLVYADLSEKDKKTYAGQYPALAQLGELYVIKPNATYIQLDVVEKVSGILGMTRADIAAEEELTGAGAAMDGSVPSITVVLRYRLQGPDLLVRVDPAEVSVPDDCVLYRLTVLPNLGASTETDDGYLFLPVGSGAIIDNDRTTDGSDRYELPFYGTDFGKDHAEAGTLTPEAPYPVFGIRRGEKTVFGIVESGDGTAGVTAALRGANRPENTVAPWWTFCEQDVMDTGDQPATAADRVYSRRVPTSPFALRYRFLYGEDATYSGMAGYYRTYLARTDALPDRQPEGLPIDLTLIGAITTRQTRLGVPVRGRAAASAFSDTGALLSSLHDGGIGAADVLYTGMLNGGIDHRAAYRAEVEACLGGADGFAALLESESTLGVRFFPAADLTKAYRSGGGLSSSRDLVRTLSKRYAVFSGYHAANGERDTGRTAYLIGPARFDALLDSFLPAYRHLGCDRLYADSLGALLYGDYDESGGATREESRRLTAAALSRLSGSGLALKLDVGNAYALRYADSLVNVPTETDDQRLFTAGVPFTGMVLHGRIAYTGTALGRSGNVKTALLRALECGAGLHIETIAGDLSVLNDAEGYRFSSVGGQGQTELLLQTAARWRPFYEKTARTAIARHEILPNGLVRVTYDNGCAVLINYAETAADDGAGHTVEPLGFVFID